MKLKRVPTPPPQTEINLHEPIQKSSPNNDPVVKMLQERLKQQEECTKRYEEEIARLNKQKKERQKEESKQL